MKGKTILTKGVTCRLTQNWVFFLIQSADAASKRITCEWDKLYYRVFCPKDANELSKKNHKYTLILFLSSTKKVLSNNAGAKAWLWQIGVRIEIAGILKVFLIWPKIFK